MTNQPSVGWKHTTAFMPDGDILRHRRKGFGRIIGSNAAASQFDTLLEGEAAHFLLHLLESPEKLTDHIKRLVPGSVQTEVDEKESTET